MEISIVTSEEQREKAYNLRYEVFVGEQDVPPDMELDEFDPDAFHVVAEADGEVVGTGRLVVEGDKARIGRMAVQKNYRKHGIGTALLTQLEEVAKENKLTEAYLHAQTHAQGFYHKLGYSPRGEIFDEAGIPHIEMYKTL